MTTEASASRILPCARVERGADFSSASGDFNLLGAFFCNFATLSFLGRQPESAHGQSRARVPYLVGSRLPRPYHFRARIQSFQAVAAPFPGDSVCRQRRNASVRKIDDRLGGLRRGGDAGTNVERPRNFGKKFVERLGVTQLSQRQLADQAVVFKDFLNVSITTRVKNESHRWRRKAQGLVSL
jgi:hypothetical protein